MGLEKVISNMTSLAIHLKLQEIFGVCIVKNNTRTEGDMPIWSIYAYKQHIYQNYLNTKTICLHIFLGGGGGKDTTKSCLEGHPI